MNDDILAPLALVVSQPLRAQGTKADYERAAGRGFVFDQAAGTLLDVAERCEKPLDRALFADPWHAEGVGV